MYFVDRSIALIQPKQPFLDWLRSVEDDQAIELTLSQLRADCNTFLIPQYVEPEEAVAYIDDIYLSIFKIELSSWYEDETVWPKDLSLKAFWETFDISIHTMVIDTVDEGLHNTPLMDEE
ncbi:hypothetical protein [Neisseria sp. Ec49-e6-T10]|uniref:hypothetical protein n=1 Tax=Neisseria sp. Ec49-e6-T10 TaxID=3140744 RepID=UPI003EBD8763